MSVCVSPVDCAKLDNDCTLLHGTVVRGMCRHHAKVLNPSPAFVIGKIMVKILFAVLLLQPPTCLANPLSRSFDLAADGSGTPKIL